jgi:hypothetical protein
VDLGPRDSAEAAMIGLEKIMEAMNPKRTCKTWEEIKREEFRLAELRNMSNEDFHRQQGRSYAGTREEYQDWIGAGIAEQKQRIDAWDKRHAKARRLLDNLGGASKWKDAKLDWDCEYDPDL